MLPPYTKPHLSFADQLALLVQRGMAVTDPAKATLHLQRIGYGRLTPYWQPFQDSIPDPADPAGVILTDQFRPGAEFRHAVDLYLFDKQLRLLFLDAIERIEVALRVELAHALGKRDPWAHRNAAFLDAHRANRAIHGGNTTRHQSWLDKADQSITRSKEPWVAEFFKTYNSPVPIWMAVELWDFGTLSWLLEMAHPNDRAAIAKHYGLLPNTLVSWIRTLAFVRNICAHHSRLWNAGIINQPLVPKPFEAVRVVHIGSDPERRNRIYGAAVVASYFVARINPGSSWPARMKAHWQAFPVMPFALPPQGGFLAGWDQEAMWA
ncbi:DNA-binding protein (plasmid) [Sphingobium sp. LB126]|uniref:Abi family protein n=1 Tax=Sphingobium sp. LB126 TaxID=1983755 RepID=UPI000C206174|nr:Abi family protein [Sphingobium sp. LB126]PJG44947.1 DNA-binding protein [Sphingobium sp. LB126]PJG45072.1 DNA-binding protein [Sphingobium sp. LB126]